MPVKKIAIYLPQFHSIPENDEAWGEGFTEWTNVKKAKPLFEGHYQPHVPHDSIGYYDLRDPEVLLKQAAMAKAYGIDGFAYYHYWFNGKRLLNGPLDQMLKSGEPDFPFCYIWANENWTRKWDGADDEIIIKQEYSLDDDVEHIRFLCENVFSDKRYITIDGKPLFLVYRPELFPDINATSSIWRREARKYGIEDLYLVKVENFDKVTDPATIGFDGALEFAPDWQCVKGIYEDGITKIDYPSTVLNMVRNKNSYKCFRSVFPGWDNSSRRKDGQGICFTNNDPQIFKFFLECQLFNIEQQFVNDEEKLVFINAWNEWGEGCHIEPDHKFGDQFLLACKIAESKAPTAFELHCLDIISTSQKDLSQQILQAKEWKRKYELLKNSRFYKLAEPLLKRFREGKSIFQPK